MRRTYDFYETPPHYVAALFDTIEPWGVVYEPCAGDDAIARLVRPLSAVARVRTNDVDDARPSQTHWDATDADAWVVPADWVITNAPFAQVFPIAQHAVATAAHVALLVRLSFFEPTKGQPGRPGRGSWLEAHPPTSVIVLPRYSFRLRDNGSVGCDTTTCAWAVWSTSAPPGVRIVSEATAMVSAARRGWYDIETT